MARSSTGLTQHLFVDTAVVTDEPFSVSFHFKVPNVTTDFFPFFIGDKDAAFHNYRFILRGSAGDVVSVTSFVGGNFKEAVTTTSYVANVWHQAGGVWASITDRRAFLNGGGKGTNTDSVDVTDADRTSLLGSRDSTPSTYVGQLAEVGIWDVALTDAEMASLGKMVSPLLVRPQNLVAYWPLVRDGLADLVGGLVLTDTSTTVATHSPAIYPTQPISGFAAAVAIAEIPAARPAWNYRLHA